MTQIFGNTLYADDEDEPTGEVEFTSSDELNPSSSVSVDLLSGNDSWGQRFAKVSQMFKNIRYLLGKLGTTDISTIGNGTVTGAISTLNNKNGVFKYLGYSTNQTSVTFTDLYGIGSDAYQYFLIVGGTSGNPVLLHGHIDVSSNDYAVHIFKVITGDTRIYTGTFSGQNHSLTITSNTTMYGGFRLLWLG